MLKNVLMNDFMKFWSYMYVFRVCKGFNFVSF
jgi:hypothetical protein